MTYEIKYEPVIVEGVTYPKYNIYYSGGPYNGLKELHSTDGIVNSTNVREGYKLLNGLNWLGLEQSLVYSGLFSKAVVTATPNWFNVFTAALQNGKRGETSESFLSLAISNLGVSWTSQEIIDFNNILTANNFTIQLT